MDTYEDIIDLERPPLTLHRPMPLSKRAAQFMPFAALRGYEAQVEEAHRHVEPKRELSEEEMDALNQRVAVLAAHERERPLVRIVRFVPDKTKAGGTTRTLEVRVRRVDFAARSMILEDRTRIAFDEIEGLEGELFERLAEEP